MTAAITIHFKQPELTAGCIDTLLADGWDPVLVWDNSADDGLSLQPLQQRYALDTRVLLISNSSNLGFGNGMNAALLELSRRGHGGTGAQLPQQSGRAPAVQPRRRGQPCQQLDAGRGADRHRAGAEHAAHAPDHDRR